MKSIKKLINMEDRIILLTGGGGKIAYAIAEAFAEMNATILLLDNNNESLTHAQKMLTEKFSIECDILQIDLENLENEKDAIIEILNKYETLDVLINCAALVGTSQLKGWSTDFINQSIDTWRRAMEVNLNSVFLLSQICFPYLRSSGNGSIINIASTYGLVGPDWKMYEGTSYSNPAAYSASKGGLIQLTKWLASTLAPNIRVNTMSPGGVFREHDSKFHQRYNDRTLLKRMANEEDFKGAALYLGSDLSAYVTGHNLVVDGGWTAI